MTVTESVEVAEIAALRHATLRLVRRLRKHSGVTLTPSQMSALTTLARHGTMRVGELARREQIGKSSVTRLVAKLEELGHLDRQPDPEDGRSYAVGLTGQGRQLLAESNDRANAYLARQFAALTTDDRRRLLDSLPALERLLDVKA